jgi:hypothetical protein
MNNATFQSLISNINTDIQTVSDTDFRSFL